MGSFELNKCLCCDSDNLRTILDLGNQSPANNYNITEKFPLKLNVCLDCSHAQISHSIDPDILFKDYPYMSGVSKTMLEYYEKFAIETTTRIGTKGTVYEIACNDGSQLDEFKKLGYKTFGIDPAQNLHNATLEKGHKVTCGYFPQDAPNQTFDVIVAQNVLAHNPNPYEFLLGCKKIMHKDSILMVQTSQAKMIENHQFDTIYHEHISFFNSRSISKLLSRVDMEMIGHEFLKDIHGGSDLFILKKMPEISIQDYSNFQFKCYDFAQEFKMKTLGKPIIIYGAAAKIVNLIRFTGIKPICIIDDTPTKQGKSIDGIPIVASSELDSLEGYILPVWNFYNEIKYKVEKQYPGKFKFIKYQPTIEIE